MLWGACMRSTVLFLIVLVAMIILATIVISFTMLPIELYNANVGALNPSNESSFNEVSVPELVERINNFTLKVYGRVLERNWNKNTVVSPFNIYIALTLLYEGANGSTRRELGSAMGLADNSLCKAYQELLGYLPLNNNDNTALIVANAIWLKQGYPFREEYIELVRKCYDAEVKYFESIGQLVSDINEWVSTKTRGLIRELISRDDVDENVVAVIVSVIYFKANWVEEFKPTSPIRFWTGEAYVEVPAMELISDKLRVIHGDGYTVVEVPYNNTSISMIVIVPENHNDIRYKYQKLVIEALNKLKEESSRRKIWLIMPKFNITLRTDLVEVLKELGVREVFTPGRADLTRMANVGVGSIWVSKVVHQAVIKVNEKGTEAAAATAIIIVESLPVVDEEVVVDKPFIYMIWDRNTNTILFIGHVVNPIEA